MSLLRGASIRRKLIAMALVTAAVALVVACAAFVTYEFLMFDRARQAELVTMADVLAGTATAALEFNDRAGAQEILEALKADPRVVAAEIFTTAGESFAAYRRRAADEGIPAPPRPGRYRLVDGHLLVGRPVVLDGKETGLVVLRADSTQLYSQLRSYATLVLGVLAASSLVAFFLSSRMERMISGPILHLAETAVLVSERKDYSLRAACETQDELGALVLRFNGMLAQIEQRDAALQAAHDTLEEQVNLRTRELQVEVNERRQAEEALQARAAELARSNAELEQFAYVASHDLQEPLRMVASYTQLLARRYKDRLDTDAEEFIAFAVDGARRMQELISDLLAYSRVGTRGKGFEPTCCTTALKTALANLAPAIEESGASIDADPLPTVHADGVQLVQVFQNLLGNAVKFRGHQPLRVRVTAERRGAEWLLTVEDNGIGIEAEYAERIFVVFQRLHGPKEYPGTGIGLSICRKVVERHGGRIWMEPRPGGGSVFHFTLPAQETPETAEGLRERAGS